MPTITTKSGRVIRLPDEIEESAIERGIDADSDAREWTDADFATAKTANALPPAVLEALARGRGRPRSETPKVFTGIRFDPDVLASFRATGKGWQTRINDALREWLATHPISEDRRPKTEDSK
jgi:uncharacterized protein (DUF4415 family)